MKCKYCDEDDESNLVLRSSAVNGKTHSEYICMSCLWKKLLGDNEKNGKILSEAL